jgi:uncharacterized protein (TIGR02271 family)
MLTKEEFVRTHPDIRVGMTAYSMDGEKLGVIERVDDENLTIERGWFFHKDFMIPYDDIEDIREDQIIVRQRREDFEEAMTEESADLGESDLTGRAAAMGKRTGGRVKDTGERLSDRAKESGEYLRDRAKEMGEKAKDISGYGGREEGKETRIPVREEELQAEKRAKESEVGIHKEVHTETQRIDVPIQKEDVIIERGPADKTRSDEFSGKAFQEEDIRIPVKEEEVEVTKRPVVKEEVRVRKETRTENQPVSGEVRKEDVKIEPAKSKDRK